MRGQGIAIFGWLILVAGGCGAGAGPSGQPGAQAPAGDAARRMSGVAVIDLDEIARRLGRDLTLVKAIRDEQAAVNEEFRNLQSTLQQTYQRKKRELEAGPGAGQPNPDAPRQQLAELERQLNLQLNQAARNAQSEIKTREQRLIQQFRDDVKPVAREVAAARGLGVVVTKNESVLLDFDDAHDITADVAAKMRAAQQSAASKPAASVAGRPTSQGALR